MSVAMRNKMDRILVDCDDVLLNWTEGFKVFLERHKGIKISGTPQTWDLSQWTKLSKEKTMALVEYFNQETEEFGQLTPTKNSELFLGDLHTQGFGISVITSCSDDIDCIKRRQDNLTNVFGDIFEDIICLPLGVSKGDYLKKFEPSFWVEDNYHNCVLGKSLGHNGIIIRHDHNRDFEKNCHSDLKWTNDWHEINSIIEVENTLNNSQSFKV